MKIIVAAGAIGLGLSACAPTPDEYATRPAPVTYQTVVPVAPAYPTVVYTAPAPAVTTVPVVTAPAVSPTIVVPPVVAPDPIPRGSGVSAGTSPQPVLSPAQKAQDKVDGGGGG
jgi:hypothetical protein